MTADQPQTQTPPHQVEPEPLPPVVSLAEAAHLDPAQAPARLGTGSWDRGSMAIVVPYDPTWPQRFQAASAEILAATDHLFLRLEHIGSTSVPGLAAKPTIDMMASVRRLPDGHAAQPALAALGYELADTGMRERLFFQRLAGPGVSTHHLHVVTEDSWATRNERLLRDYLRGHPGQARRYAELKRRLSRELGRGEAYTRAKTALIQELVDAARDELGLPPRPGLGAAALGVRRQSAHKKHARRIADVAGERR
jgi:GrpB-like predicted nucleotidyltransferase (UPF0157 family)